MPEPDQVETPMFSARASQSNGYVPEFDDVTYDHAIDYLEHLVNYYHGDVGSDFSYPILDETNFTIPIEWNQTEEGYFVDKDDLEEMFDSLQAFISGYPDRVGISTDDHHVVLIDINPSAPEGSFASFSITLFLGYFYLDSSCLADETDDYWHFGDIFNAPAGGCNGNTNTNSEGAWEVAKRLNDENCYGYRSYLNCGAVDPNNPTQSTSPYFSKVGYTPFNVVVNTPTHKWSNHQLGDPSGNDSDWDRDYMMFFSTNSCMTPEELDLAVVGSPIVMQDAITASGGIPQNNSRGPAVITPVESFSPIKYFHVGKVYWGVCEYNSPSL